MQNRPYAKLIWFAIPMLIGMVLMNLSFPQGTFEGYANFIIAFEFVQKPSEVHTLLLPLNQAVIDGVDMGNYIDFGFMFVYSSFLFLFFKITAEQSKNKLWLVFSALSILICLLDVFENIELLSITAIYSPSVTDEVLMPLISKMEVFTSIKWELLAISFCFLSLRFFKGGLLFKLLGILAILPFVFSFWAFTNHTTIAINAFTLTVMLNFLSLFIYSFVYRN